MNSKSIELFYDVGSTNSYFALHLLKRLAVKYGVSVVYQPLNLGYLFRSNNYVLMDESKAKLRNRKRDLMRWAQRYELPFRMPHNFPIKTSPSLRGALAARRFHKEEDYLFAVFSHYWEGEQKADEPAMQIDDVECLVQIARSLDIDGEEFSAVLNSPAIRQELIEATKSALDRGVFGAPSILIGDELYWGKDRMEFVEDELKRF